MRISTIMASAFLLAPALACAQRGATTDPRRNDDTPVGRYYVHIESARTSSVNVKLRQASSTATPVTVVVKAFDGTVLNKASANVHGTTAVSLPLPAKSVEKYSTICAEDCYEVLVFASLAPKLDNGVPALSERISSNLQTCIQGSATFFDPKVLSDGGRPGTSPPPDPEACL
jgi:hypothetical protein